ncbi:hypothetical protein [Cupriavidus malaysiensis]|uniref:Uncharacterized protein n=1 Tax=Cupriavidus malaysiensis TaxID=367825 RepID=A0ABM6FGX6_9BURK|nr:hypothetical protein [Cupriavidus malaysiensis]AOZ11215.1 hypothetical protein BKK80_35265 [Cupriavidus malaysiensis]
MSISDTEIVFQIAVDKLLNGSTKPSRFCGLVCPDQYVGAVSFSGGSFHVEPRETASHDKDFTHRLSARGIRSRNPRLIMVLESPHLAEFGISTRGKVDPVKHADPGPARGPTGTRIRQKLGLQQVGASENFHLKEGQELDLLLVNAIQHQCSLGEKTSQYRDRVFEHLWGGDGRASFGTRLAGLYSASRGDVILNCCTVGGNPKNSLKAKVRGAIEGVVGTGEGQSRVFELTHPFHWGYQRRSS